MLSTVQFCAPRLPQGVVGGRVSAATLVRPACADLSLDRLAPVTLTCLSARCHESVYLGASVGDRKSDPPLGKRNGAHDERRVARGGGKYTKREEEGKPPPPWPSRNGPNAAGALGTEHLASLTSTCAHCHSTHLPLMPWCQPPSPRRSDCNRGQIIAKKKRTPTQAGCKHKRGRQAPDFVAEWSESIMV